MRRVFIAAGCATSLLQADFQNCHTERLMPHDDWWHAVQTWYNTFGNHDIVSRRRLPFQADSPLNACRTAFRVLLRCMREPF